MVSNNKIFAEANVQVKGIVNDVNNQEEKKMVNEVNTQLINEKVNVQEAMDMTIDFETMVFNKCKKAFEMNLRNDKAYTVYVNEETEECFIKEGGRYLFIEDCEDYSIAVFEETFVAESEFDEPEQALNEFANYLIDYVTESENEQIKKIIKKQTWDWCEVLDYIDNLAEKYPDAYNLFKDAEITKRVNNFNEDCIWFD